MPTRREDSAAAAPAAETQAPRDPRVGNAAREGRRWQAFRRAVHEARAAGAFAIRANGIKVWLQRSATTTHSTSVEVDEG